MDRFSWLAAVSRLSYIFAIIGGGRLRCRSCGEENEGSGRKDWKGAVRMCTYVIDEGNRIEIGMANGVLI